MIRYRLQCPKTHEFEAWFPSSDGFDDQVRRGLVACPRCGSKKVAKALMAPSVVTGEQKARTKRARRGPPTAHEPDMPSPPQASPEAPQRMLSGPQREMLKELKALRDKILSEAEYVGPKFADEARKIHSEEKPARGIFGEASPGEVKELAEEGIDVFPVPVLPDDQN